MDDVFNLLSIL